ncbi:MAG: Hpt domain-containing protein [Thiovulaceae bacterium]|nr:Hpt domain-containing protein [Sulfurimonadaceae bacterium]
MKIDHTLVAKELGISEKHIPLLINSFLDESKSIMENLTQAVTAQDFANIALYAHSIKGSAANLRISDVQEKALAIELAGKENNAGYDYPSEVNTLQSLIDSIEY